MWGFSAISAYGNQQAGANRQMSIASVVTQHNMKKNIHLERLVSSNLKLGIIAGGQQRSGVH